MGADGDSGPAKIRYEPLFWRHLQKRGRIIDGGLGDGCLAIFPIIGGAPQFSTVLFHCTGGFEQRPGLASRALDLPEGIAAMSDSASLARDEIQSANFRERHELRFLDRWDAEL